MVLRLLAHLVKLVYTSTSVSSGCGLQGSVTDHTELLESLYEKVWSHSKFLPVMCLSHDHDDDECADSDQNELKGTIVCRVVIRTVYVQCLTLRSEVLMTTLCSGVSNGISSEIQSVLAL